MIALIASTLLRGVSGVVYADVSSAYIASSGSVCDIYPVSSQELDLEADFGEYGRVYWCGWLGSALHDRQRDQHRMAFFELETMLHYIRDWALAREWSVRTAVGAYWDPQIGYPDDSKAYYGPQAIVSLENPYVTPYLDYVEILDPTVFARARVGLRRTFSVGERWRIIPVAETVWSDRNRCHLVFGDVCDYGFCGGAFTSVTCSIRTEWQFAEQWYLYFLAGYLTTLGDTARDVIKRQDSYWAKCDWPFVTLGCAYAF